MTTTQAGTRPATPGRNLFDVERVRAEFPALHQEVNGHPLVYLDNGATSHKPRCVIDAVSHYYEHDNSNVHRGVHALAERATRDYEASRDIVQRFVNAASRKEIVFTRGTTECLNLVAWSYARPRLEPGDRVLISGMEHHSNIVPWQLACRQTGAVLDVIPVTDAGELDFDAFLALLGPRTRVVSVMHLSNTLGTVNPVERIVAAVRAASPEAVVVIDGAQSVPRLPVDVQAIGCDFYAFSGHKTFGPTGTGVLWGRESLLDAMEPWQGGGDMIRTVSFEESTWNDLPYKFEAGTPNVAGAIGLGAALTYLESIGMEAVAAHEDEVVEYAAREVGSIPGVRLIGTAARRAGAVSFLLDRVHAHDVGQVLDGEGVAIRAGHHCTMPLMKRFGVAATARASFALYNTREEVDKLVAAIHKTREMLAR